MIYDHNLAEILEKVGTLHPRKIYYLIMATVGIFCFIFLLLSAHTIHGNHNYGEKSLYDFYVECLEEEKFFYRGFFSGQNKTYDCVASHNHLAPDSFIIKKACVFEECEEIQNPFVTKQCYSPHPLTRVYF